MKTAYFDCFSGISGDMTLGALVDIGLDPKQLVVELTKLNLDDEFSLTFEKTKKQGISGTRAIVTDMQDHHHHGRHLQDIFDLLDQSDLEADVICRAKKIFDRLTAAEATVHDMPKSEVHLHEVSAIDSIIDIVGSVIGLDLLEIEQICASAISLGSGFVRCAHGLMPVPVPGTMELLRDIPIRQTQIRKELVTPTGAAIITTLAEQFGLMPEMTVQRIGYGAGSRDLPDVPNLLRVVVGEKKKSVVPSNLPTDSDQVMVTETNIDDQSAEITAWVVDQLFAAGALDVFLTSILMKKGRPGTKVTVLSSVERQGQIAQLLLQQTTTFGVRTYLTNRQKLTRDFIQVTTPWGPVTAKRGFWEDKITKIVPEYEDCRRVAETHQIPLRTVYDAVRRQISQDQASVTDWSD